jgi:ribosome-associated protein
MKKKIDDKMLISYAKGCRDMIIDKKGEKVSLLDLRGVSSYLDYFLICTGTSRTHLRSLAKETQRYFAEQSLISRGITDLSSDWIILDYSEIVVHLFTEETRAYYDLDKLWSDAKKM